MRTVDKVLSELVNSFYRQKPLPKTAIVFKMKMIAAIKYCKEFNLPIPDYDAHRAAYLAEVAEQERLDNELADIAHGADKIGDR